MAKALATEAGSNFIAVKGPEVRKVKREGDQPDNGIGSFLANGLENQKKP